MRKKSFLPFTFLLTVAFWAVTCFPVHAADGKEDEAVLAGTVAQGVGMAQEMLSNKKQAMFERLSKAIDQSAEDDANTSILLEKMRYRKQFEEMPAYSKLKAISQERAVSGILTEDTRRALDDVNYRTLQAYGNVPNIGVVNKVNPGLDDNLTAVGRAYTLHINLFCNPDGMDDPPEGCGKGRANAGIKGNENFVDFMLSERTWPKEVVLDTMQLARVYFFNFYEKFSLPALKNKDGPAAAIAWQRVVAENSLRMSMLNVLAARRAPTSSATKNVLEVMLQGFGVNGSVSSTNYEDICDKDKLDNYIEAYVCNMTNIPAKKGEQRVMGQATIDRIMQHDFYLSPLFYNAVNSPNDPNVSMERMEVFLMAQQVTQDYYFLRMLQMKTAAAAISITR